MAGTITEPDVTDPMSASSTIASFALLAHPRSSMCGISTLRRAITVARASSFHDRETRSRTLPGNLISGEFRSVTRTNHALVEIDDRSGHHSGIL